MLGRVSNFVQGNPVYDFDHNDYVGAYVQDDWRVRPNLTVNVGPALGAVPADQELDRTTSATSTQARFDAGHPQHGLSAGAGRACCSRATPAIPGSASMNNKLDQFAPRAGVVWQAERRRPRFAAAWGVFYDTPHLFFNTRFANNPPWGAQITLDQSRRRLRQSVSRPIRAAIRSRRSPPAGRRSRFRPPASTSTRRSTRSRRRCSSGTSARSGRSATGSLTASYLGNHSSHLWRATELNYAVFAPGATTATTNARRRLVLKNPAVGAFYGTIGQLDDTGRANYNGMLLSAQRRLKGGLSVLSNYTLSKCMSDPATTELTGPTIIDPTNPDARLLVLRRRIAATS